MYQIGKSVESQAILALKVSKTPERDAPEVPEVVYVGGHHAREWISVEVTLDLAAYVLCAAEKVDRVKALLEIVEMWFIPVLNPDGYQYSFSQWGRMWRKNRADQGMGQTGVDLNRNYDYLWGKYGASSLAREETFRGRAPNSEPEVNALRELIGYRPRSAYQYLKVTPFPFTAIHLFE